MEPSNDKIMETNKINSYLNHFMTNEPEYDQNPNLNKDSEEKITINETQNNKEDNNLSNNNIKSNSEELDTENLIPNPNDNCFKRLQEIQKLLKKESSLKELFIRTNTETLNSIEKECREIYTKKLDVFTNLQKFSRKQKEIRKYLLLDEQSQKDCLRDLNNYIPKFLLYLWDEPKLIVKLLQNSNIKDIRNHLAPLITNNFYENILSVNYIEENFLYILCLLLKDEIQNLNSTNDVQLFLQETPCGCLLDQLINKNDIKSYFKIIMQNVVENIENSASEKEMNFNRENIEKEIQENFMNNNNNNKKGQKNKNAKEDIIFRKDVNMNKDKNEGNKDKSDKNNESLNRNYCQTNSFIFNGIQIEDDEKNKKNPIFDIESYNLFSTKYIPDLSTNELYLRLKTCDNIKMKDYYQF